MKLRVYNSSTGRSRILDTDLEFTNITERVLEFSDGNKTYQLVMDDISDYDYLIAEVKEV